MPLVGWGALHGSTPPFSSVYLQGSFQSIPPPGHILTSFSRAVDCHLGHAGRFKVGEGCRAGICKSRENSAWAALRGAQPGNAGLCRRGRREKRELNVKHTERKRRQVLSVTSLSLSFLLSKMLT